MDDLRNIAQDTIKTALKAGADHADCVVVRSESLAYGQRLGRVETMEQSQKQQLGLRIIKDGRQALISSNDMRRVTIGDLAERAVAMANAVPQESECLPADAAEIMADPQEESLQLWDDTDIAMASLIALAGDTEETALAEKNITNSEGSSASVTRYQSALAISNGFCAAQKKSQFGVSVSVIAGEGENMQTDYDYAIASHWDALPSGAEIGKNAAQRTIAKLGARQATSVTAPVVFAPRAGRSLLGSFFSAINGENICKGTSFLQNKKGERIFPAAINIIEDPLRKRSLAGRVFDGEGLAAMRRHWVADGILQGWLLDMRTARKLGMNSTANAGRAVGAPPSPMCSNAYIANGEMSEQALIADIVQGFYVTQMMGMGVNGITGDFSQGAEGFWIENGKKTYPVQEMTIAGNLLEMFAEMAAADNLEFEQRFNVPTLRAQQMTIAGSE